MNQSNSMDPIIEPVSEKNNRTKIAKRLAGLIMKESRPVSPVAHLIKSAKTTQLFLPNGSRLYTIHEAVEDRISFLIKTHDEKGFAGRIDQAWFGCSEIH